MDIELGDKVLDTVSGYTGIAVSKTEYINGCTQYGVQGKVTKDKGEIITYNIDAAQLEKVNDGVKIKKSKTGGPTTRIS